MGKASSAKKVARAASSSSSRSGQQQQLGYPIALALLVVFGVALVTYARQTGGNSNPATRAAQPGDQNAAWGIYVCDHYEFNQIGVVPKNKALPAILAGTGLSLSNTQISMGKDTGFSGRAYKTGTTKCNGKPARIEVVHWVSAVKAATGAKPDKTYTTDVTAIKKIGDLSAVTIAYVPAGTTVPAPPNASTLTSDSVATTTEESEVTTTTIPQVPGAESTTVP